jgi:hypothetical protein
MSSLFWSHKTYRENFILVALILFKSTQASVLAFAPETTVLALIYTCWIFYKRGLKVDNFILVLIYIYSGLNLYYLISFDENDFFLSFYILIKMIYAYLTIKIVRESFFPIYEKILYSLAIISFPLFVFQLFNYELLFKIVGILQNNISFLEYRNDRLANLFIFTLESHGSQTRNSGFAWEPKGFANFLLIAMFVNLILNNFRINKRLIIFFIALLTTLSTTGFIVAFILFPILLILNKRKKSIFLYIPITIISGLFFLSLDIGYEKIKKEIDGRDRYKELLADTREFESRSLGRFPSFILDFKDFLERPVLGYGFNREARTQSEYTKLVRVNGVSDILATYGAVGFLIIFITTFLSFKSLMMLNNAKGNIIVFMIILVIYFATALTSHPFWMVFYFLFFFGLNKEKIQLIYKIIFHEKSSNNFVFRFKERPKTLQTNI